MAYGPPWVCSCGVQNWQSRQKCYGCGGAKPVGQDAGGKGGPGGCGGKSGKGKGGLVVADASVTAPWAKGPAPAVKDKELGDFWPPLWEVQARHSKRDKQRQKSAAKGAGKGHSPGASARLSAPKGTDDMEVDEGAGEASVATPGKAFTFSLPRSRYTAKEEWEAALEHWQARYEACKASPTLALEGKEAEANVAMLLGPLKPTPEGLRSKEVAALQSCNAREISLKDKIESADKDIAAAKRLLRQYQDRKEAAEEALDGVRREQADLNRAIESTSSVDQVACEGKTLEQLDAERNDKLAQVQRTYQAARDKVRARIAAKGSEGVGAQSTFVEEVP